jgi:RecB family exonuclease
MGARIGDLLHRLIAHEVYGPGDPRTEALVKSLLPPAELPLLNTYVERVNAHLSALQSLGYEDRLRSLPRNARRCEVELDLVVDSTDQYAVRFTGFIDMLVSTEAGRWRILDFKTNAVGGMDIARFTREHLYDLQMELYMAVAGLALSRAGRSDTIEKAEIVYTSAASRHQVEPDSNAMDRLLEVARSIFDGRFEKCEDACDTCGYEAVCRSSGEPAIQLCEMQ